MAAPGVLRSPSATKAARQFGCGACCPLGSTDTLSTWPQIGMLPQFLHNHRFKFIGALRFLIAFSGAARSFGSCKNRVCFNAQSMHFSNTSWSSR